MLKRFLSRSVPAWKRLNGRLVKLEAAVRELQVEKDAAPSRMFALLTAELDGVLLAQESLHEARIQGLAAQMVLDLEVVQRHYDERLAATRLHTDAATQAVELSVLATSRAHAEAAAAASATAAREAAWVHANEAIRAANGEAVDVAREYSLAAAQESLASAVAHSEALHHQTLERLAAELSTIRRELAVMRRTTRSDRSTESQTLEGPDRSAHALVHVASPIADALYVALEDRFRGSAELISERQSVYLPLLDHLIDESHPAVDLGCGRGEWLRLLRRHGLHGFGVDSNSAFVAEVVEDGLTVEEGDLVKFLHGAADASLGAVTMFQVVEHLPFPVLVDVLTECARVLRPGGLFLAETPNALNLRVAASTFWIDPTHQRPLHPELLVFLATQVGFAKTDGWFLHPLGQLEDAQDSVGLARDVQGLRSMVDGPGDFTLLAWA